MQPNVTFAFEWENADWLDADEAYGALRRFSERIAQWTKDRDLTAECVVVFEGMPDAETVGWVRDSLAPAFPSTASTFLATDDVPYYNKKGVIAHHAKGEIIVFSDCDCVYCDDWLDLVTQPIFGGDADLVYGMTYADPGETLVEHASTLAWFFAIDDAGDPRHEKQIKQELFRANNFAIRRSTMMNCPIQIHEGSRAHGTFWIRRLRAAGARIVHQPQATSEHKQFDNIVEFLGRAPMLAHDRTVTRCLRPENVPSKLRVFRRAAKSIFTEPAAFLRVAALKPGRSLIRDPLRGVVIVPMGLAFSLCVALSSLVFAFRVGRQEVHTDYSVFLSRTTHVYQGPEVSPADPPETLAEDTAA